MNRIETEVRAERDKLALEVAKLERLALRKLRDQWRDEPHEQDDPCEVPEQKFSDDCWDEHGQLVLVPTDLPRLSLPEAAVRLAILHDFVFSDGRFEAICAEKWYDTLSPRLQVRVTCFRRLMDKLDQAELTILRRCLIYLQEHLDNEAKRPQRKRRAAVETKPLTARQAEIVQIVGECKGDIAETARRLGVDRKTVDEAYKAAMSKLGVTAVANPSTTSLSHDRRGQTDIADDGEGPAPPREKSRNVPRDQRTV